MIKWKTSLFSEKSLQCLFTTKCDSGWSNSGFSPHLLISSCFLGLFAAFASCFCQFSNVARRSKKVWLTRLTSRKFWAAFSKIFNSKRSASSGVKRAILYTSWMDHWLLQLPHTRLHWPYWMHTHTYFSSSLPHNPYISTLFAKIRQKISFSSRFSVTWTCMYTDASNICICCNLSGQEEFGLYFWVWNPVTSSSCLKHQSVRDCGVTVCPQDISARRESYP